MSETIMKAVFRVDGGGNIGFGHIMRCLSLAEGLRERDIQSIFITRDIDSEAKRRIVANGHLMERLPPEIDLKEDLNSTINLIKKYQPDLVITDSYEIDQHYLEQLKRLDVTLMSIDDLVDFHFCSDIVLNQNIGVKVTEYSTERYTKLLLGPKYALLRKELRDRGRTKEIKEGAENILVSLGGTDPDNQSLKVAKALKGLKDDVKVTVIMGPGYQYEKILREEIKTDKRIILTRDPKDIFGLIEKSDIAISAGGSTCYELAYLGVPNIILVLADNQRKIADGLDSYGISINLGWFEDVTEEGIKEAVGELIENRERREEMNMKGRELVDGKGVERVVEEICAVINKRKRPIITEELIQSIAHKIVQKLHPNKIFLFGSYAYGSPKKGSDLDLLIVKESDSPRHKRSIPIRRLFRGYMIPMDILVYTPQELQRYKDIRGSFVHKVLNKGKVLYG